MDAQAETLTQSASKPKRNNWKFYCLLGFIIVWYLFTIWYQAFLATDDTRQRDLRTFSFRDPELPITLTLQVAYPQIVPVSPTNVNGQPLAIWLLQPSAAAGISNTAPVSGSAVYRIALRPFTTGLAFVNKDGVPVAPEFIATSTADQSTPWTVYVRRTPEEMKYPMGLAITLQRLDGHTLAQPQLFSVPVDAESISAARWRQFLAFLFSPTAPLIGLAVALAWKWYDTERKRQEEAQKADRFGAIYSLRHEIERNNFQMVIPRLRDLQKLYAADSDATKLLAETRTQLDQKPWQKTLLAEAVNSLQAYNYADALQAVDLVLHLDESYPLAAELKQVILAAQQRNGALSGAISGTGFAYQSDSITPLLQIYQTYPGALDRLIGNLLAEVIPQDADRHLLEFQQATYAYDLLNVHALAEAIDRTTPQSVAAQNAQKQLRQTRQERWYRIIGMHGNRIDRSRVSAAWLKHAELAFNPFGPELAEDDPWLPDYAIDKIIADLNGSSSVWVSGPVGWGKTTAALLLAFYCFEPTYQPRIPDTFPIYFVPSVAQCASADKREWSSYLAMAATQALIRFLAVKPLHFFDLPTSRQKIIARLLLTCWGTSKQLSSAFRETGLDRTAGSLVKIISQWDLDIPSPSSLDQAGWIELLNGALPAGFTRSFLIIDFPPLAPEIQAHSDYRQTLFLLPELLHPLNIYLKVFEPLSLVEKPELSASRFKHPIFKWEKDLLALLLSERLQQASRVGAAAGRDRLEDLCEIDARGSQIDQCLIEAAKTPRDVIHWGNRLFEIHADQAADNPELSLLDIERWQREITTAAY
jgi:hypothetical protein